MYQPPKLVDHDYESILSLMLAFVKVCFSQFNSFMITITGPDTHSVGGFARLASVVVCRRL